MLVKRLGISEKTVYKHLARLSNANLVIKSGTSGKTFYSRNQLDNYAHIDPLDHTDLLIEQNYIYVSPSGEIVRGLKGFNVWCDRNNINLENQKTLYSTRLKDLGKLKTDGLISAIKRVLSGKGKVNLDEVFFSDFYTFNQFGKTKLG